MLDLFHDGDHRLKVFHRPQTVPCRMVPCAGDSSPVMEARLTQLRAIEAINVEFSDRLQVNSLIKYHYSSVNLLALAAAGKNPATKLRVLGLVRSRPTLEVRPVFFSRLPAGFSCPHRLSSSLSQPPNLCKFRHYHHEDPARRLPFGRNTGKGGRSRRFGVPHLPSQCYKAANR
jgi:hypothetical protein